MTHETDPTGRSAHDPGSKLDAGKPRPALVLGGFARALSAVTEVGTFGASKYTDNGWRTVPNGVDRYTEAMMRHYLAEAQGLKSDPDSNLLHAAHLAWNALARLDLLLSGTEQQDAQQAAPELTLSDFKVGQVWRTASGGYRVVNIVDKPYRSEYPIGTTKLNLTGEPLSVCWHYPNGRVCNSSDVYPNPYDLTELIAETPETTTND